MPPQEQARIGLCLLTDAIVEYLRAYPEGRTPHQSRHDLGLDAPNRRGERGDHLMWGLHNLLEADGRIRLIKPDGVHTVMVLPASTTTENAERTPAAVAD